MADRVLGGKHRSPAPGESRLHRESVAGSGWTRGARANSAETPGLAEAPHLEAVELRSLTEGVASGPLATKCPRVSVLSVLLTRGDEARMCPHKSARAEFLLPFWPIITTLIRRPEAPPRHSQERPVGCRSTSALGSACDPASQAPSCRPGHPPCQPLGTGSGMVHPAPVSPIYRPPSI